MNPEFVEMLSAWHDAGADYLVIGAHALAAHGPGPLAIWTCGSAPPRRMPGGFTPRSSSSAPHRELQVDDLSTSDLVFQIGVAPARIDILTSISGVTFEEGWASRISVPIGPLQVPVIGRDRLIQNKRAAGRPRDLADLADLEG